VKQGHPHRKWWDVSDLVCVQCPPLTDWLSTLISEPAIKASFYCYTTSSSLKILGLQTSYMLTSLSVVFCCTAGFCHPTSSFCPLLLIRVQHSRHHFPNHVSQSVLTAIFPGEPGLAGVIWSKGWWKWWWQLEL